MAQIVCHKHPVVRTNLVVGNGLVNSLSYYIKFSRLRLLDRVLLVACTHLPYRALFFRPSRGVQKPIRYQTT